MLLSRLWLSNGVARQFLPLLPLHLHQYSTTVGAAGPPPPPQPQPPENHFLVEFLINTVGFSRKEALTTTKKVTLFKSSRNDPNLVLNYFQTLGLSKTQIKILFSSRPTLLTTNVGKTLQPRVQILQEYRIRGSDFIRVFMNLKSLLDSGPIRPRIEYLRNLLGSDENLVKAINRYISLIGPSGPKQVARFVESLKNIGFSDEDVSRLLVSNPRLIRVNPQRLEEIASILENEIGIYRDSKMFYHGINVLCSFNKLTLEKRFGNLRNFGFGWSNETILGMIRKYPYVLQTSDKKIRQCSNFFVNELGYPPDYLASRPVILNLSFEKRVKPRCEVLKILNEKKLCKIKASLYRALCISEPNFVNEFLLPHNNEIPADVFSSYFNIVGSKETGKF